MNQLSVDLITKLIEYVQQRQANYLEASGQQLDDTNQAALLARCGECGLFITDLELLLTRLVSNDDRRSGVWTGRNT